jgi:hypothetical protein
MNPNQKYPNLSGAVGGSPLPPTAAPAPMEQPMPPMGQEMEMATPEQMQELRQLVAEIENKFHKTNMRDAQTSDIDFSMRQHLLTEVFDELRNAGVDLEDQESVANFLEKLKEVNPELEQAFEGAMAHLMETPQVPPATEALPTSLPQEPEQPLPPVDQSIQPPPQSPEMTPFSAM